MLQGLIRPLKEEGDKKAVGKNPYSAIEPDQVKKMHAEIVAKLAGRKSKFRGLYVV